MKKGCLLILGGGSDQLFMIKCACEMGLDTAVVDRNPNAPGLSVATYSKPIDFSNTKEVIDFAQLLISKGVDIKGVSTMGSDVPHLLAEISSHFNWVGPTKEIGRVCTDKHEMKICFKKKDIPTPRFSLVSSTEEVLEKWEEWGCQNLVIKPTDRAGSRGVSLISSESAVENALNHALSNSLNSKIILEEYIKGPQISTESIIWKERIETPGFADRVYEGMESFWPQIMENGGWVPTRFDQEMINKVNHLVMRAAKALGIEKGVAKGDVAINENNEPMMIEMAARLSGGDFSESLVPLGSGVNYVKEVIRIALGQEPNWLNLRPKWKRAVANRYFFTPPGKFEDLSGVEIVKDMSCVKKFELFYDVGSKLSKMESHNQRLGVVIIEDENHDEVQKEVDKVYDALKFKINGKWVSGKPHEY